MATQRVNITDRAERYRAQNNVTGPKKCVICGARGRLDVMHLTGNESHGEKENLAYGCRSCNGQLAAAFKAVGAGRPTNQYNPAKGGVPSFEQYMWAVSNHSRGSHDAGGAIIHATPKHKRIEYARRIVSKAQRIKRERFDERWNPSYTREQLERLESNPWPFSRSDARRTTPATGGIAHHMAKAGKRSAAPAKLESGAGTYRGYQLVKVAGGEFASSLDPQSWFETKRQTKEHIDRFLKGRGNPSDKWHVEGVAGHPGGVFLSRDKALEVAESLAVKARADISVFSPSGAELVVSPTRKHKKNPASASAEVFEEFHGFAPSEVITVTKHVHHHEHLAAAGKLVFLKLWGIDQTGHMIKGFKGALLAFNEQKNQLFVEGGDQRINLEDFGIDPPHELETLGRLVNIGYQTNKTHLGDEGGEAVYVHKFRSTNRGGKHIVVKIARYPDLIYDVRNEQLLFSGGSYEILSEGINK